MENNIVNIQHVFFSYGALPVLEDINITIEQRDYLAIIGPNGGGKTTTTTSTPAWTPLIVLTSITALLILRKRKKKR